MPHNVTIRFDHPVTNAFVTVAATFEDEEWATLLRFAEEVRNLEATKYIKKKSEVSARIEVDVKKGVVLFSHQNLPTPDELAAVLHRIRPFILHKNEPLEFGKVVNSLRRRFENEHVRRMLDERKDVFHAKKAQSALIVKSREVILNSEDTLMAYLNAYEYHRAPDLKAQIDEWFKLLPVEHRLYILIDVLCEKIKAIISIGTFIDWLKKGAPGKIHFRD